MSKRELVANAIRDIRIDIRLREKYADEQEWDMYEYMWTCINTKISFMLNIGLISVRQWERLDNIVNRF